jgi:FKBP-type peptidyl-prolyl cis-trans isomerase FkpA
MRSLVLCALLCLLSACHDKAPAAAPLPPHPLQIIELSSGAGSAINDGQTAVVDYMGWIFDAGAPEHKGRLFDSSRANGAPLRFTLGRGQVIKGWDRGVLGMKIRGRRQLIIPPDLAYGDRGAAPVIPPAATLIFDVELVSIE